MAYKWILLVCRFAHKEFFFILNIYIKKEFLVFLFTSNKDRSLLQTFLIVFIAYFNLIGREGEEVKQAKVGNLAVVGTMQPAPFLGFGETIINQYDALFGVYSSILWGKRAHSAVVMPYLIYGFRNDVSLFLAFPTAASLTSDQFKSTGSHDMIFQIEYAFYQKEYYTSTNQFSLVTAVYLPTGDELKEPATGFGSPSFFLGIVADRLSTEWYCYNSYGVLFTTKSEHDIKSGNQFFYEGGLGKNIAYAPDRWTLLWLLEFSGLYVQKGTSIRVPNQEASFNMIMVGPSLWFSTNRMFLQVGIAPVVHQHLGEGERKHSFFAGCDIAVRFN
jgi:hypothetical protein